MAFDAFRTRFITSVFFSIVMLGGVTWGKYTFAILFSLIALLCLWEFLEAGLKEEGRPKYLLRIIGTAFGLLPFIGLLAVQLGAISMSQLAPATALFPLLLFIVFLIALSSTENAPFQTTGQIFTALVYIGLPFILLGLIAFDAQGGYRTGLVLGLVLLTWTNDTWAYLIGSRFGKTPLLPRVSPKKTWEGTLGGGLASVLMGLAIAQFTPGISILHWVVLAFLVFVFGTLGDLVESMFKRSRQIKDSGHLLPGHGGLLDRFDGFIFHLPFTAAYVLMVF
jgi:phosphatidate cytidylyltransferase